MSQPHPPAVAPNPAAPWVVPGQYTVRLTAGGRSLTQPLTVRMDPRVKTTPLGLQQQFTLSKAVYDDIVAAQKAIAGIRAMPSQDARLTALVGAGRSDAGRPGCLSA